MRKRLKPTENYARILTFFHLVAILLLFGSCKKYLDAKPEKSIQIPKTTADLQALLDYADDMNNISAPALEVCSDDYYLPDNVWNSLTSVSRKNLYIWERDVFNDNITPGEWASTYIPVYKANVVLEGLEKLERISSNASEYDQIKGAALLYRSRSFFEALQVWALPYDHNSATNTLGIPLRLGSDFNEVSVRSSIRQCYDQVIANLKQAAMLLPVTPQHVMRPSRPAAFGLLARTYLVMQDYENAGLYADSCLQLKNTLIDYNVLNSTSAFPLPRFNAEIVFSTAIIPQTNSVNGRIDSTLYRSYSENDLRKKLYFKAFTAATGGGFGFKGSYYAANNLFNGIATDEMLLIRAESKARKGSGAEALEDLNALLLKRYATGKFVPYSITNTADVLGLILTERRKELLFRGLRWADLKRLNKESRFRKTLKRNLNGNIFELLPGDRRYALAIPNSVIELSGIPQN
ncbi:RagB/SusD family nutrient uptake outer membrane protein [Pedobacter agri]|uniref:RagB/SusD family nutrient uptake outer membrane protein n=1 Tax=Pedobacter agri TaxID=454586 RepID=A0A9X3I879_9SPHI|nr:RagB/SusD family nutrient uptake outer membrane protein [Pedobacter agri]MCX3263699.1 RagB/SusD family nutrient uptake outer membrane protein [Pedobacter agri]